MENSIEMTRLVREASMGDKECMEKLLKKTHWTLFAYLYRLTMDYHLAEDLLQQVQMEIVVSLWRLKKPDRFWPWIFKHAWGIVRQHFRENKRRKEVSMSGLEESFVEEQFNTKKIREDEFFKELDRKTLFEAVYETMKKISLRQRTVMSMRCYNDMTFDEIAQLIGCSETNARVSFFRAKKNIQKGLRKKGFRANIFFLPALGLFGTVTSKSAASTTPAIVSVSQSTLNVGYLATLIGMMTSKVGLFLTTILTSILAWFSIVNALFIGIIFLLCIPFILVTIFYMVFCE